jgi:hypothetical protein
MIEIDDSGKPVTEKRLADLERELGVKLPAQYRQFLLKFNGGMPSPDVVDIEGMNDSPTDVQEFFGIDASDESSDLRWIKQEFSDRVPDRMIPVACDSGNNLFCLSLSGADSGAIIYMDLRYAEPKQYIVAENFDLFLGKIREWIET